MIKIARTLYANSCNAWNTSWKEKTNHKTQKRICILFISALNTQLHFQYGLNDELVWKSPSQSKDINISDGDNDSVTFYLMCM